MKELNNIEYMAIVLTPNQGKEVIDIYKKN